MAEGELKDIPSPYHNPLLPLAGETSNTSVLKCCETGYGWSVCCGAVVVTLVTEEPFHATCAASETMELNGLLLTVLARGLLSVSTDVGALAKVVALGTVTGSTKEGDEHAASLDTSGDEDYSGDTDPKAVGLVDGAIVS